jgi:hypothetical protein
MSSIPGVGLFTPVVHANIAQSNSSRISFALLARVVVVVVVVVVVALPHADVASITRSSCAFRTFASSPSKRPASTWDTRRTSRRGVDARSRRARAGVVMTPPRARVASVGR